MISSPPEGVYLFEEGAATIRPARRQRRGLCEMTRAGLPVPPGLVVTTEPVMPSSITANSFLKVSGTGYRRLARHREESGKAIWRSR